MSKLRWPALVALLLLGALPVAACGESNDAPTTTSAATATEGTGGQWPKGTSVAVSLSEWAIDPVLDATDAGEITFTVTNEGTEDHEFAIIRSDKAPDTLPIEAGVVPEDAVDLVTKIEQYHAGKTERLTANLAAGNYLLICNIAGHYQLGMTAAFTVN